MSYQIYSFTSRNFAKLAFLKNNWPDTDGIGTKAREITGNKADPEKTEIIGEIEIEETEIIVIDEADEVVSE